MNVDYMEDELDDLLKKYFELLRKLKIPLTELLQNGIDKSIIVEKFAKLKLNIPEEVFTLYSWKNGTFPSEKHTLNQMWVFPGGILSSIDESIEMYQKYAGLDSYWTSSMFMLFEDGGGEMYLIDTDRNSPTYKMIIKHSIGAVDYDVIITVYDSLEALFKSVLECFETGAYNYESNGKMQFDWQQSVVISRKYNPRSDLWKLYE
jgi:hypothetical protein